MRDILNQVWNDPQLRAMALGAVGAAILIVYARIRYRGK